MALGLTNGEIAVRLVLSRTTVRTHLENIFAKLDVHTRTAAVARQRAARSARLTSRAIMGTSVTKIDRAYGHLARDSEESIRARLETRSNRLGAEWAPSGESADEG